MSRAPASRSRRLRNPKIVGSSPEPAALNPGQVKSMTLLLGLLLPSLVLRIIRIGQGLFGSVSGLVWCPSENIVVLGSADQDYNIIICSLGYFPFQQLVLNITNKGGGM